VDLTVRCGDTVAGPGAEVPVPPAAPVQVCARISGAPGSTVVVRTAAGVAARTRVDDSGEQEFAWDTSGSRSRFVRVEVRRPGFARGLLSRMVALTNPVWLRPAVANRPGAARPLPAAA
jgi:hypothetical protein